MYTCIPKFWPQHYTIDEDEVETYLPQIIKSSSQEKWHEYYNYLHLYLTRILICH